VCSVIKVILQFCKENGLTESFNALQVSLSRSSSVAQVVIATTTAAAGAAAATAVS
jgi:hypothetical protein